MLGHNEVGEIVGIEYANIVPSASRKSVLSALAAGWQGHGSSLVHPLLGHRGDRTVAASFVPIFDLDGGVARIMLMCDDITERYANAKRLEAQKKFTDAVIDSLPGTFFVYAEDGKLVRFNGRFLELNGYSEDEARAMRPEDFFEGQNKKKIAESVRRVFGGGEGTVEADMTARDGRCIPMAYSGRLLEQHGQRFMVGVGIDISERRRNEARFRAEKKFGDTVVNAMPGVFYVINEERRIVRWNNNLLSVLGLRPEDMKTLDARTIIAEADRVAVAEKFSRVFATGESLVEASFITTKGEVPYLMTGVRLQTDEGAYMVGMGFDISERRHYEAQLRASENYLRSVIESEPECVWTLERDGRLRDINPAGRMLLGDAVVEAASQSSINNFVVEEHRGAFRQLGESVFAGHSGILTFQMQVQGATVRWLETHAVALRGEHGEIDGHLAVTRDITEKREAESKIREYSDRLQLLSQRLIDTQEVERRHLARELHDEVGQSLTALKLNLEDGGRGELRSQVDVLDSVRIVDRVLRQVRDMSLTLRPAILDDLGLLPALRWYVDGQAKRAKFRVRLVADSLTGVRLDSELETAAFRIVQEALNNVIRHARATKVIISLELDSEGLSLMVRDDGSGFKAEDQLRRASQGAGFGLLGIQERAALIGGHARIESREGEGVEVCAWLPLAAKAGGGPSAARAARAEKA